MLVFATVVGQQGPGGTAAEGRMAYVGRLSNPVPEERGRWADPAGRRPDWPARYVAQRQPLAQLAEPLRRPAGQGGRNRAERWRALSEGGSGLEDFLRSNFPLVAAVLLDCYHVAEYRGDLAKALHPGREEDAAAWRKAWCSRRKAEGGVPVLAALRALAGKGRAACAVQRAVVRYFANHVQRMDYPSYRAKGWQIGSGPVESACKTVLGQRLKGGGMRWGANGADAVGHWRALFRREGGQWEAFWSRN